jgi:hypothetical protein
MVVTRANPATPGLDAISNLSIFYNLLLNCYILLLYNYILMLFKEKINFDI